MDAKRLEHFKLKLVEMRKGIINGGFLHPSEDLKISSDDLSDETDLASNVINQQVSFSIRGRELQKLREIEAALFRIEGRTFGHCLECDEEIGTGRLENQPWATLCIVHAEEKERSTNRFSRHA